MRGLLLAIIALTWFLPSGGQELVVNFTFDTVCLKSATHFISVCYISDTSSQSKDSIVSYAWDMHGDGKFDDGNFPVKSFTFPTAGLHNAGLKVITKNGLAKALYKMVPVNYLKPAFKATAGCIQEPVKFTDQTQTEGDTAVYYFWQFGDGTTLSGVRNPQHFYSLSGDYLVTLTTSFRYGCQKDSSQIVHVKGNPQVVLGFSRDTVMRKGDTLFASVQGTYDSVRWSRNDTTYTISITKAGYYSVKAYEGFCFGQAGFTVTVNEQGPEPVISNIFTPNGDGHNDLWEILNLKQLSPCQVDVFNRYGLKVFTSSDYKNDWDGTFNGRQLSNDTYFYFVRCFNQALYKGNVNILK